MNEEIRLRRGLMVAALSANHPLPLRRKSLDRQVAPFYGGNVAALDADYRFLVEIGIVGEALRPAEGRMVGVCWLTESGVRLAGGEVRHPDVTVEGA